MGSGPSIVTGIETQKEEVKMANDLVPISGGPLALPDHLKGVHTREGLENVTKNDLVLPRVGISQSTHPQLKRGNPLYIEALQQGLFFNDLTNDVYGETLEIIALLKTGSRIWFKPLKEGGGILCRSLNGIDGGTVSPTCDTCAKSKWKGEEGPECTEFLNFPVILAANKQLAVISFKSTALKPARKWVTRMNMMDKPIFAAVVEVRSNPSKNAKGDFFVPSFSLKRWTTSDEFAQAQAAYNSLKGKTIIVEPEVEAEDGDEKIPF
jgi:hypothetical protein